MTETTPAQVAASATIPDTLPMGDLTLIGVMTAHDGPAALLRSPRGRIARVTQGTRIFGVTITGISDAYVTVVTRGGASYSLQVPGQ